MDGYSKRVQERIGQLTKKAHDAERRAEEAFRKAEENEAFARAALEERQNAYNALEWGRNQYLLEVNAKLDAAEKLATLSKRQALESGDTDAIMQADAALHQITVERAKFGNAKPVAPEDFRFSAPAQQPPQQQVQQPETYTSREHLQQEPVVDIKGEEWVLRNPWFSKDPEMTALAMGVHAKLKNEGRVPLGSDEYYAAIDQRMAEVYPTLKGATNKRPSPVAPAGRAAPGKTKVKLTPNQKKYADAHNIPYELMAQEIYKLGE